MNQGLTGWVVIFINHSVSIIDQFTILNGDTVYVKNR